MPRATSVFLGSPPAAVPSLLALAGATDLQAVVTRPPARQGRGRHVRPTPVAQAADGMGVPVHTSATARGLFDLDLAVDLAVVVGFGVLIPGELLEVPRRGFVNVHFSLLPRWRGAAPVERAILAGDERTGVSLMQMDAGLDTGPVLATSERAIADHDAGTLTDLLAADGARLLAAMLDDVIAGAVDARNQVGEVTYAHRLRADEGRLPPGDTAGDLARRIRAFTPRPGAWLATDRGRLKVWSASPVIAEVPPGTWVVQEGRLLLGVGTDVLWIKEVQAEGSRRMTANEWANGIRHEFPMLLS